MKANIRAILDHLDSGQDALNAILITSADGLTIVQAHMIAKGMIDVLRRLDTTRRSIEFFSHERTTPEDNE